MGEISPAGTSISAPPDWARGYEFIVNDPDVWVTELGYVTPSSGSYELALWDVATATKVASVTGLGGTSSSTTWEFFGVAPVALTEGGSYRVTLYGIGSAQYYWTNSSAYHPSGTIEYQLMRFSNFCGTSTMPGSALSNYNYGFADIGYQFGAPPSTVPLPGGLALGGAAFVALAMLRRRRRA